MRDQEDPRGPIVLFDGICNLCVWSVRFILARDPREAFRFASLQGETGRDIARHHGADPSTLDTIMLLEDGRLYTRSTAALRIARRLRFPWWPAGVLLAIPPQVRDLLYGFIAARRYRWFGKKDQCMIPSPEVRQRFLD